MPVLDPLLCEKKVHTPFAGSLSSQSLDHQCCEGIEDKATGIRSNVTWDLLPGQALESGVGLGRDLRVLGQPQRKTAVRDPGD